MTRERRKFPRVTLDADLRVRLTREGEGGLVRDLSESGVFIFMKETRPIGTGIDLTLLMPEGAMMMAKTRGLIVHEVSTADATDKKPAGIGVMFIDLSEPAREAIRALIKTGTPC